MPSKYGVDDVPEESRASCAGLREDLKHCLINSDCVQIDRRTPKECLHMGEHPSVPDECRALRVAFFECKRSMLDMRARFRGKKGY